MSNDNASTTYKIFAVFSYLIMVIVNVLANAIPINNITTGKVSALYPNLFTPASYTFSIWALIYILLVGYVIYQLISRSTQNEFDSIEMYDLIRIYFIITSFANATWIFAWHYDYIALSMSLMVMLLVCLIMISKITQSEELSRKDRVWIKLPVSVYFGWITIATIANATILLVSMGWNRLGLSEVTWTVIVLVFGLVLGSVVIIKHKDIMYGLVLVWAYMGILVRHISVTGFDGKYPPVIYTLIICIVLYCAVISYVIIRGIYKNRG